MIYILLTIIFMLLQAFYSGIETGLISIQKPRVNLGVKQNNKGAKILAFFLSKPSLMLSTCLLGTNICVVCASVMAKKAAESLGYGTREGYLTASLLLTLMLLAAEIIPKNWFRQQPYQRCLLFATPLYISFIILKYPAKSLSYITDFVSRHFSRRGDTASESKVMMRDDFRLLLRESESADIIDSEAADILDRSIDFYATKVGDICIQRDKVSSLLAGSTIAAAVAYCTEHNTSRMPVYINESTSKWVGIFSVYDAIFNIPQDQWEQTTISRYLRPIQTIPANSGLNEVLQQSNRRFSQTPLLVVTEPGEVDIQLGIITPQDVVRKLFG